MLKRGRVLTFLVCVGLTAFAQTKEEVRTIEPGKVVEGEIAGAQTHTYQFSLQSGQFARFVVEQIGVDVTLSLIGPDGKPLSETNLTSVGGQESLSLVADRGGQSRLVARAFRPDAISGA